MIRPSRLSPVYAVTLFAIGLLYRATFINQGYNATDEGWLQSMAARILSGQVPYRDFYFGSPPVSIYEQAILIQLFGQSYGILASRWAFNIEVSLCSVLAYLILLRFAKPTLAFLATVPTCFFSVILFYFTNYSYDGEFLALLSLALLVHSAPARWHFAILGGLFGAFAFMAKPTFLGLLPIVLVAASVDKLALHWTGTENLKDDGIRQPLILYIAGFALGCVAIVGYFAAMRAGSDFINRAFLLPRQTYPISLTFLIWQDLPEWMLFWPNVSGYIAALLAVLLVLRVGKVPDVLRLAVAAGLVLVLVIRAFPSSNSGLPTARQDTVLLVAIGTLLLLNFLAIALTVTARGQLRDRLFPPELPVMALGLQYVAQFNAAGVRFSYYGAFLSLPVALLLLWRLASLSSPLWRNGPLAIAVPRWTPALLGVAMALSAIVVTHGVVFRDGPRSQLTSTFRTPLLAGIRSLPANTERVDGVVAAVMSRTQPGDAIFVMPDFPVLYYLTGRRNPTPIGWYETPQVSPSQAKEVVAEMKRDPPKLVILETYDEGDFLRLGPRLDYEAVPQWRPIYLYIIENYRSVEQIGDIEIYVPNEG